MLSTDVRFVACACRGSNSAVMPRSIVLPSTWTIRRLPPTANTRTPHMSIWRASPVIAIIASRCRGSSPVDAPNVAAVLSGVDSGGTHVYHGGSCSHVNTVIVYYRPGSDPAATASAVGSVHRGPCSPVIAFIACCCRRSSPVAAAAVPYDAAVPPHELHHARHEGIIMGYVYTLSLLLSSWAKFAPGSR